MANRTRENYNTDMHVAIIGGGIQGLGVALALAEAGHSVEVFEESDKLANKTSAGSLRIIHGGFRYLQTLNVPRIIKSLRAQAELLRVYPEFIKPLPCLMPLKKFGLKSKWPMMAACLFYTLIKKLLRADGLPSPGIICSKEAAELCPLGKEIFPDGALLWFDAQVNSHSNFVERISHDLQLRGTKISLQTHVTSTNGKQVTLSTGERLNFDSVIQCTGPSNLSVDNSQTRVDSVFSANLLLSPIENLSVAVGFESSSGRLFFLVPRGDKVTALGTIYFDPAEDLKAQLKQFWDEALATWPALAKSTSWDGTFEGGILAAEAGVPATKDRIFIDITGAHRVVVAKYTTFVEIGRKVARRLS